jgi:catechol 2,3-dioxygenase-like lactoylglutathione lyase family enzyme
MRAGAGGSSVPGMLNGIHHLTTLTADLDRLIGFYERVFDARVTLDLQEEGLRHAFIELGPGTVLHPFEVPGVAVPQGEIAMFARGRLDHFGLNAAGEMASSRRRTSWQHDCASGTAGQSSRRNPTLRVTW